MLSRRFLLPLLAAPSTALTFDWPSCSRSKRAQPIKTQDCGARNKATKLAAEREKNRRGGSAEFSGKTPTNPRTKRCSGHWIAVVMETWMFTHRFTLLQVCWMVGYYLRHDLQLFERSKFPRICQGFDSTTRAHSGICSDLFSHCLPWPLCFQRYLLHQQPEKTLWRHFAWLQLWIILLSQTIEFYWMALVLRFISLGQM